MSDDEIIAPGPYRPSQDSGCTKIGRSGQALFKGKPDAGIHKGRLFRRFRTSHMNFPSQALECKQIGNVKALYMPPHRGGHQHTSFQPAHLVVNLSPNQTVETPISPPASRSISANRSSASCSCKPQSLQRSSSGASSGRRNGGTHAWRNSHPGKVPFSSMHI